jgi:hypothetical protein
VLVEDVSDLLPDSLLSLLALSDFLSAAASALLVDPLSLDDFFA